VSAEQDRLAAAARLVAFSAAPKESPATSSEYAELMRRYFDDPDFASAADAIASGLGLNVRPDPTAGMVTWADSDSFLRRSTAELVTRATSPPRRALLGTALLGIARVAYRNPARLDDPASVATLSVALVVDHIDRLAARLAEEAEDPEAGTPDLAEAHRAWTALPGARIGEQRASMSTRPGLVGKVAGLLVDAGYLRKASDLDGGTYRTTPRFAVAVRSMLDDSDTYPVLLAALSSMSADTDEPEADGDDTETDGSERAAGL
jgi:hypothetical protein